MVILLGIRAYFSCCRLRLNPWRSNVSCRRGYRPFLPVLVGPNVTRHRGQAEYVVEFAIGEQSNIGCHHQTTKLEHQAAVKIAPKSIRFRLTRRVRHTQSTISCRSLYLNRAPVTPKLSALSGECGIMLATFDDTADSAVCGPPLSRLIGMRR